MNEYKLISNIPEAELTAAVESWADDGWAPVALTSTGPFTYSVLLSRKARNHRT